MKQILHSKRALLATVVFLLTALAGAGLLTSCSTTTGQTTAGTGFKFWVMRYRPAVDATAWVSDPRLSADPEGAALNIATAMRRGSMEEWLANWEPTDRPQLTPAQSEAMLSEWKALQGGQINILGRVVAESDVIVELSVGGSQANAERIQIPLQHSHDRWWLTAMDPSSEYLHWENSPNKTIDYIDPDAFQKHLNMIQGAKPKEKAETAPAKNQVPIAGL